jgi:hypothetical protein
MKAALTLVALIALPAAAEEQSSCPLVLQPDAVVVRAPAGWKGYSPSPMRLSSFGMMAGPPESLAYLKPYESKPRSSRWIFEGGGEKWLYCTYDESAAIQISKRLNDNATECTLTYKRTKLEGITAMEAICQAR